MEENTRYNQNECGFDEEAAVKAAVNNPAGEKTKVVSSPAADRISINEHVEQLENRDEPEQIVEVQTEEKVISRNEKKNLKRELKSSLLSSKKMTKKEKNSKNSQVAMILLVILAFLLPWLAVGLYTDWDVTLTVISVILWLLFWVPGIVFALLVIFDVI